MVKNYERRLTPSERFFMRSPFAIVTVVARIKGNISKEMLTEAVSKVQQRHTLLRVRIKLDDDNIPWFTSEGVKEIPIDIVPRNSDDQWVQILTENSKIPFEFDERPCIRFVLVQSPTLSELIISCHHITCDGMSLAYLARDLMVHLGNPTQEVEVLADPEPVTKENIPDELSFNFLYRWVINRINKKWEKIRINFDQEDYKNLSEAYWRNFNHQKLPVELSEVQTSALVERCKKKGVTVNSALTAAFAAAQVLVQGDKSFHKSFVVAASVRDRLATPAGEVMGFYAGGVVLKYKYNLKKIFWKNARMFHQKIKPQYTNKNIFDNYHTYSYLNPAILESINFKLVGGLIPPDFTRFDKLSAFSKQKDVVSSILKREGMVSLEKIFIGTAVTNLTRLDFSKQYGALELDRLLFNPGGGFPLAMVNLVLGAVTCAGKFSLIIEYAEEAIDTQTMEQIKDKALELLLSD